jgi:hypothetical protein
MNTPETQSPCRCEKTACERAGVKSERCTCGAQCACEPRCDCGAGCDCGNAK